VSTAEGLELLEEIDWTSMGAEPRSAFAWWSRYVRDRIADPDDELLRSAERYPNFLKFRVADRDGHRSSVRLHYFWSQGDRGSLHSHRWPFWAVLLAGSYGHTIFGVDEASAKRRCMTAPLFSTVVSPNIPYGLHPSVIHQVETRGPAVSLVLRGPVTRQRRFIQLSDGRVASGVKYEMFQDDRVSYPKEVAAGELLAVAADIRELLKS
jgi:hypothetical protein